MSPESYGSIFIAVIFAAMIASLILNEQFRSDMLGKGMPNKVTSLGVTVEGGTFLVLLVILVYVFVHMVDKAQNVAAALEQANRTTISLDQLPYKPRPTSVYEAIERIKIDQESLQKGIDLVDLIKKLSYGDDKSKRKLPRIAHTR